MNKIKSYHLVIEFVACILFIAIFAGCGEYYDETNATANQRIEKMTAQEKTLYKAVESEWNQRHLIAVREAVGRRETRPPENQLPFVDIANVIKTCNTAALKLVDSWTTQNKNDKILARWDRVDEDWYRKLMLSMGVKEVIKQELIPEEQVIDDKPKQVQEEQVKPTYITRVESTIEIPKVDMSKIIPEEDYDELYYEIKKCDKAVEAYKEIIEERLLTYEDYEYLKQLSIGCKAKTILSKMEKSDD